MTLVSTIRSKRVNLRLSETAKRRIERAASVEGKTVSGFILSSALESAEKVIDRHDTIEHTTANPKVAPAPKASAHEDIQRIRDSDRTAESSVVDPADLDALGFMIGFYVKEGIRKAPDVIRAIKKELGEGWDGLKAYFTGEYEIVRTIFENEAWVGEMTPQEEVQAAVDAEETISPASTPEAGTSTRLNWNSQYEVSKPRLIRRMKALIRITDQDQLPRAIRTIAAIRNLPEVGEYGGDVRVENRMARKPGDSDFIYSLFVSDERFELNYHERLMMGGGQRDYTNTLTLARCEPLGWETDEDRLDEEALANMREVSEMMRGRPFDDEEWQVEIEAVHEMQEVNLPNGIEHWLEMLPVDDEGICPKTVTVEWEE